MMRCWTGMKKSIHKHWNMWPTLSMTLTFLISTGALRANLFTKIIFSCQMDYWIQKSFEGCWVFRKGWNSWIGIHKVMWWIREGVIWKKMCEIYTNKIKNLQSIFTFQLKFFSTFSMIRNGSKRKIGHVSYNFPHTLFFKITSSHSQNPFFKFRSEKR